MATLESIFRSISLLWERIHITSGDTVQAPGLTSMLDAGPGFHRRAAGGRRGARRVLCDPRARQSRGAVPQGALRYPGMDWLFSGGFDDSLVSLKTTAADPPVGDFIVFDRELSGDDFSGGKPSIVDVEAAYRIRDAEYFERGILVVREDDLPDGRRTHLMDW